MELVVRCWLHLAHLLLTLANTHQVSTVQYSTIQYRMQDDYVQFGRDILFITSYRSDKFCHRIQVSTLGSTVQYM